MTKKERLGIYESHTFEVGRQQLGETLQCDLDGQPSFEFKCNKCKYRATRYGYIYFYELTAGAMCESWVWAAEEMDYCDNVKFRSLLV